MACSTYRPASDSQADPCLARQPCFGCDRGLETCESCDGNGHWKDAAVCDRCIGIGLTHCAFCNGTGLVTYNAIPDGLRIAAMIERVNRAVRHLKTLAERPLADISRVAPHDVLKQTMQVLVDVDRWLGVLENALLLAKAEVAARPKAKAELTELLRTILQTAAAGYLTLGHIAQHMAEVAEREAAADGGPQADKRARFYGSLLGSPTALGRTGFEHPFLTKALRRVLRKSPQGADSAKVGSPGLENSPD